MQQWIRCGRWLLCTVVWSTTVVGETWYVRPGGKDTADGRTAGSAFRTVLRAATALNHGDNIVIAPGVYRETVLLAERYAADGREMSVIGDEDGKLTGAAPGPVIIEAASATQAALRFHRWANLKLAGLTFRGPGQGLHLDKCVRATIERCTFDGPSRGLAVTGSRDIEIRSSVFARCTIGISCQGTVGVRIAHVTVAGASAVGILALGCGPGAIGNSILVNNNTAIIADAISAATWASDHNVLTGACGPWGDVPAVAKIHEWFATSGQDRHSVHVAPAFVDPDRYDLHIAPQVTWGGGLPGMAAGKPLAPVVARDRDGRPFRTRGDQVSAGAYDYPDPAPAPGWTMLAGKFPEAGPRQSAGIYGADGSLVRTLLADAAGVRELWWNGLDDQGEVVPAGQYQLRLVAHDLRVVDDGSFGDNGSMLGAYNCDNVSRVAPLPDGGFLVTTHYDEAGFAIRRYSASGQPVFASNHAEKEYKALAAAGEEIYGVVGAGPGCKLVRLVLPGERAPMRNQADFYPIVGAAETNAAVAGLAVAGDNAFIALGGLNVVRVIDLATGQKRADWSVPAVADIAADPAGTIWVIAGKDLVSLTAAGAVAQRLATGLDAPQFLAAGKDRFAVFDPTAPKIALLGLDGQPIRTLGKPRADGEWTPVGPDALRDLRGGAFLRDGRLVTTEWGRTRIYAADGSAILQDIVSTFVDTAVVHPTRPEYVYTALGCYRVDPASGAWTWVVEEPHLTVEDKDGKRSTVTYGMPMRGVVLNGKPLIAYTTIHGTLHLFDVSEPRQPQWVLTQPGLPGTYSCFDFTRNGDLLLHGQGVEFRLVKYLGRDAQGRPAWDFAKPVTVGPDKDPVVKRGLTQKGAIAADVTTGDAYYLAVTPDNNKMVPGWGADGTGVGKTAADGTPKWFAPSSGGNYMAMDVSHDGRQTLVLAAKSFGGQVDLFDADGLRLATGSWAWPCGWRIGFVDIRYGLRAYRRPDGKVGAYVEDDAIGRVGRLRIEGAATVKRRSTPVTWTPTGAAAGSPRNAHAVQAKGLEVLQPIPRTAPLKLDGNWETWEKAGVVPQIVAFPAPNFLRFMPEDVWQTFREGTAIGALAHDGESFYVYFVVTDDSPHFDADRPEQLAMFDNIELWIEEEQFALGFLKAGQPALFKYRHHNRERVPWKASYPLAPEHIWAAKLDDLSSHPLGRQLADVTGVSFRNKRGYAVMGRIPFAEVKLVGGIAGRSGDKILDMTGAPGEVVRIGVNFGGIVAWGREQDFKVGWPSTIMFADPTRSTPFALGPTAP